jgi:uracil-DNA glycosylase family 4
MAKRFVRGVVTAPVSVVSQSDRVGTAAGVSSGYHRATAAIHSMREIYPLGSPGLPPLPPNSAFLHHVMQLGDTTAKVVDVEEATEEGGTRKVRRVETSEMLHGMIRDALRTTNFVMPVEIGPHRFKEAKFLCGHLWAEPQADICGPKPATVMIISKTPSPQDINEHRCFAGMEGSLLVEYLQSFKISGITNWYITHLVKFMPPNYSSTLKQSWIKDGKHLLMQEISIVRPKFILCLGSDVSKAMLDSSATVTAMDGRVVDFKYNTAFRPEDVPYCEHVAKLMTVVHPRQVLRDQTVERQLSQGLGRFAGLVLGRITGEVEVVDHRKIEDMDTLLQTLIEIEHDPDKADDMIAVDAEWHGDHPVNAGSYIRSIQLAWRPHHAIGVVVRAQGGDRVPGFPSDAELAKLIQTFLVGGVYQPEGAEAVAFRRKRVVGHSFNADMEWLIPFGIDVRPAARCPFRPFEMREAAQQGAKGRQLYQQYRRDGFEEGSAVPAWYRTKYEGGADTSLMAHAIEETAQFKLELLAMRYTTAPRYDTALVDWRTEYCKANGLTTKNMEGYGECPDDILMPYGMYDADVTLRLFYAFDVLLDEDYERQCCRESFWESQIAAPVALEINTTGIALDSGRVDFLTSAFMRARGKLENSLREEIAWPTFNIRSVIQVKELLFDYQLNGKVDKATGAPVRVRPEGAMSLGLTPIFDTSKPPARWADLVRDGKTQGRSPSTNKQSLSLLAQDATGVRATIVRSVQDYRFLDQVLKSALRPPDVDSETEEVVYDEDGELEYSAGLAAACCDDGRVRTHIYQDKETGRWASARPPLQNLSKTRDKDYARLLGEDYHYPLRSVLRATPGYVLVEADFVGAELFGMAIMSGDPNMIEHAIRNQLPSDHKDYYDIHSNVAVFAFRLQCEPTKRGLEGIKKEFLRNIAKAVIFGIAYGRGAKAIAVSAKENGVDITERDAQTIIDAIFRMYPKLKPFFDECQARATGQYLIPGTEEKWPHRFICSCFGRFRRFPDHRDADGLASEFGRQAMNFPIQSMIASVVSRAGAHLLDFRDRHRTTTGQTMFKILLQIHDAYLFEVPLRYVQYFCETVLSKYMREAVPIYPTLLDGMPMHKGPYHLGLSAEVMEYWGQKLTYERAQELGLPTGTGGSVGCDVTYSKPPGKERVNIKAKPAVLQVKAGESDWNLNDFGGYFADKAARRKKRFK